MALLKDRPALKGCIIDATALYNDDEAMRMIRRFFTSITKVNYDCKVAESHLMEGLTAPALRVDDILGGCMSHYTSRMTCGSLGTNV